MGQPVVHFEVIGRDPQALQGYYAELFDWNIDASNPMGYGIVARDGNTNSDGPASAAVSPVDPRAMTAT